jgi:hypothetical protein
MAMEKNLKEELLKQDNIGMQSGEELRDAVLVRDQARVARMRKLTIVSWILVMVSMAVAGVLELGYPSHFKSEPLRNAIFLSVWQALLLLAIAFTVSLYVRSRALTMHQIQASLALIEEHLKKMSQKE